MTERGMIFNAEMVRAILDGRKTQTRRLLKDATGPSLSVDIAEDSPGVAELSWLYGDGPGHEVNERIKLIHCPYGKPGDRIWVRETFGDCGVRLVYRADTDDGAKCKVKRWTPSIHMPRWASRILLEITDVRVERLNDISEEDARAEGIVDGGCLNCGEPEPCGCVNPEPDATDAFAYLWQSIYGQENWNANPWVWVIEFKRIEGAGHETD
ncbi:hypothetical protein [Leclercia sp.]|uniref:hypothetical protein n=1 Tax=Leclercia sp. TaxID=1898428 RepID=UPI0028ACF5C3|nr:hypothetical protein [Leclercia sp.]